MGIQPARLSGITDYKTYGCIYFAKLDSARARKRENLLPDSDKRSDLKVHIGNRVMLLDVRTCALTTADAGSGRRCAAIPGFSAEMGANSKHNDWDAPCHRMDYAFTLLAIDHKRTSYPNDNGARPVRPSHPKIRGGHCTRPPISPVSPAREQRLHLQLLQRSEAPQ